MKVKEATQREVHWRLKWNAGEQANMRLRQTLGDLSTNFAQLDAGNNGKFLWSKPGNNWTSLSDASPEVQEKMRRQWLTLQHEVRQKLDAKPDLAENILSIPNEGYLFYAPQADGDLSLLVTGWGFMNYRRAEHSVIIEQRERNTMQEVTIRLLRDDEPVANDEIQLNTPNAVNTFMTDAEGQVHLPSKVRVGDTLHLRHPATLCEQQFVVVEGQTDYVWDVTQHVGLMVRATMDGKPLSDVPLKVSYHGRDYSLRLDGTGKTMQTDVPFHVGDICAVTLGDETLERELMLGESNLFEFALTTPVQAPPVPPVDGVMDDVEEDLPPAPPEVKTFSLTIFDEQGRPFIGMPIVLSQMGRQYPAQLDNEGCTVFKRPDFLEGQPISVQMQNPARPMPEVSFTLEPGEDDYVLQEKVDKPNPWENVLMQLLVVFLCAFFLSIIGYVAMSVFSVIP